MQWFKHKSSVSYVQRSSFTTQKHPEYIPHVEMLLGNVFSGKLHQLLGQKWVNAARIMHNIWYPSME
jgi:hypothetical protein